MIELSEKFQKKRVRKQVPLSVFLVFCIFASNHMFTTWIFKFFNKRLRYKHKGKLF